MTPIYATIHGCRRLLIILRDKSLAAQVQSLARAVTTEDEANALRLFASEQQMLNSDDASERVQRYRRERGA